MNKYSVGICKEKKVFLLIILELCYQLFFVMKICDLILLVNFIKKTYINKCIVLALLEK